MCVTSSWSPSWDLSRGDPRSERSARTAEPSAAAGPGRLEAFCDPELSGCGRGSGGWSFGGMTPQGAAMDALIRFVCPSCGKSVKANPDQAGRRVRCPRRECGVILVVPRPAGASTHTPPVQTVSDQETTAPTDQSSHHAPRAPRRLWLTAVLGVALLVLGGGGVLAFLLWPTDRGSVEVIEWETGVIRESRMTDAGELMIFDTPYVVVWARIPSKILWKRESGSRFYSYDVGEIFKLVAPDGTVFTFPWEGVNYHSTTDPKNNPWDEKTEILFALDFALNKKYLEEGGLRFQCRDSNLAPLTEATRRPEPGPTLWTKTGQQLSRPAAKLWEKKTSPPER
jgi:DNA-directed RNA polymerase subunit RPC12/RpoP